MSAPLEITLELTRAEETGDAYTDRLGAERYKLRLGPGQYVDATFDWTDAALLQALQHIQGASPAAEHVQWLGERLRRFLLPAGWDHDEERIAAAARARRPVRIALVSGAAELYSLPWELLTLATGERLCQIPDCLLRYSWPGASPADRPRGAGVAQDAHVLLAWSAAGGRVPAEVHARAITGAVEAAGGRVTVVENAGRDGIRAALERAAAEGRPATVLHLLCHGVVRGGAVHLVWDGEDGADTVDPDGLRARLGPWAEHVRLVVLCACHGGQPGSPTSRLGSPALALHRGTAASGGFDAALLAARERMDPNRGTRARRTRCSGSPSHCAPRRLRNGPTSGRRRPRRSRSRRRGSRCSASRRRRSSCSTTCASRGCSICSPAARSA